MQNYNNAPPPQGGHGAPPPKKGMSTGIKVLIAAVIVLVIGGTLLVALGIGGVYWFSRRAREAASVNPATKYGVGDSSSSSSSSSSSTAGEAETPVPTSEQAAAIAGGQSATWEQQEISWTVPQKWKEDEASSTQFTWNSPGSWDAAHLIVSVSPMGSDFPTEISLKSYYDRYQSEKQKYDDVRWVQLGGVKGVLFREAAPESDDDPQRLQWIGYRVYKGQTQYLSIMISSQGKYFARHEDAMYGIMYSTKMTQ